jgi:hypothetical protein
MAAPRKTLDTNPELAFIDGDYLELRRRLKLTGLYSRATIAGCVDFVIGMAEGETTVDPVSRAKYRKILRAELERTGPPPARGRVTAATKRRSGKSTGHVTPLVRRPARSAAELFERIAA